MCSRILIAFFSLLLLSPSARSQQPTSPPADQQQPASLGDIVRRQRGEKPGQPANSAPESNQSLADIARAKKAEKKVEIKITDSDAKELFAAIDEIMEFASHDSGLPRHSAVKYQLLGQEDVSRRMAEALSESEAAQRLAQDELVLKKLGYLPRSYDLKKSMVSNSAKEILAFYDSKKKTMNLTNWVSIDRQRPIMAHELTHALQDQNYDLIRWRGSRRNRGAKMSVAASDSAESDARTAVVEGQAMIVFYDYTLRPAGRTLADTPEAIDMIEGSMTESYDTSVVIHNGPLVLKDTTIFPYREGLAFELALLKKGGPELAFAGAFERPPWDTHEILEPEAYLSEHKRPFVQLPDFSRLLAGKYEAYDSGTLGQLDVRIFAQEYGTENDMFTVMGGWQGGSYVVVKRATAGQHGNETTADLAVVYVSQWKNHEAAQRFAEVYKKSLAKRLTVKDEGPADHSGCSNGPGACRALWASRTNTDEGPVFVEVWPNNMVIITESFDEVMVGQLRQAVLNHTPEEKGRQAARDLSLRLYELPAFRQFQQRFAEKLMESLARSRQK